MKKIARALTPLAAIVLFGNCLVGIIGLVVVLTASTGFAVPWLYYQRLNIGVISVALPAVGMILLTLVFLGFREKAAEAAKPAGVINLPMREGKMEDNRLKTAA